MIQVSGVLDGWMLLIHKMLKLSLSQRSRICNTVVLVWTGAKSHIFWKRKRKEEHFHIGTRRHLKCVSFLFLRCKICVSWGKSGEEPFSLTTGCNFVSSFFLVLCWVYIPHMSVGGHWFAVIQPLLPLLGTYQGIDQEFLWCGDY